MGMLMRDQGMVAEVLPYLLQISCPFKQSSKYEALISMHELKKQHNSLLISAGN